MTRWMSRISSIYHEEITFLQVMIVVFFLQPIAYFAYLSMSAAMLQSDWMSLLAQSTVEGLNLIVNISMFYSAYALRRYLHLEERSQAVGLISILLLAQILFLNPFTVVMLGYYITHFIGWKQYKSRITNMQIKQDWQGFFCALLVLGLALVTLVLKVKLQILF